jgi:hypothetical protein
MSPQSVGTWTRSVALLFIALAVLVGPLVFDAEAADKSARIREIEEWIGAQGTFCLSPAWDCAENPAECLLFVPPFDNYFGWSAFPPPPSVEGYFASFDYAGVAARKIEESGGDPIGTTYRGDIRERPLKDGRAEVKITLHTENALVWANACCDFATSPVLFGARSTDVLEGAEPTLGKFFMDLTFVNTAPGAPMPDFMQLIYCPEPGQELRMLRVSASARGPLREAFGVPDGTPGSLTVSETALFQTPFMGAVADAFPVEHVELRVVGGGTGDTGAGSITGVTPAWSASPNPLPRGGQLSFSYQVPAGGADVRVGVYNVAGRKVATLVNGFQAAGQRTVKWNGQTTQGAIGTAGVYFLRAQVGPTTNVFRIVVLD